MGTDLSEKLQSIGIFNLLINARNVKDLEMPELQISDLINTLQPHFKMTLVGEGYNQTVSSSLAIALVDLQRIIHKIYALAVYGSSNTRRLTTEDKDALEIFFRVDSGCSEVGANISSALKSIAGGAIKKMSKAQVFIVVMSIVAGFAGYYVYKLYIEDKENERTNDSHNKQMELDFDIAQQNQKHQSDLVSVIKALAEKDPRTAEIYSLNAEDVPEVVLKTTASTEYTEFNGHRLTGEKARSLNKRSEDRYTPFKEVWDVVILGINTSLENDPEDDIKNNWRLSIYSPIHDKNFNISLQNPHLLTENEKSMIWTSLDKGELFKISVRGRRSGNSSTIKDLILADIEQ